MSGPGTIMAIGAHAADMEFSAGATLLKHVAAGWRAHVVNLTLGEKGSRNLSPADYGAQKRREAEEAARVIGATAHFLPFRDGQLQTDDATAAVLARLLRDLQPRVIVTHWRHSIHADHVAAHQLTRRAFFMAHNPHFDLGGQPAPWARIFYAENWEDTEGFRPFAYVDVSAQFEAWKRVFDCFAIGRGEAGYPYWDRYEAQARIRGIETGIRHAQAFAVEETAMRQTRDLL